MNYSVRFTRRAQADLTDLYDYLLPLAGKRRRKRLLKKSIVTVAALISSQSAAQDVMIFVKDCGWLAFAATPA
jgi:plasmid stabilization system protein ParE